MTKKNEPSRIGKCGSDTKPLLLQNTFLKPPSKFAVEGLLNMELEDSGFESDGC